MSHPINLAIDGYDPTTYFSGGEPQKGSAAFASEYEGRLYYFASAENKTRFDGAPAQFAPQYGGYCAVAMSEGNEVPVNPKTYDIRDGKLYFFFDNGEANTKDQWAGNEDALIKASNEVWSRR